jgi:hypothetical protein
VGGRSRVRSSDRERLDALPTLQHQTIRKRELAFQSRAAQDRSLLVHHGFFEAARDDGTPQHTSAERLAQLLERGPSRDKIIEVTAESLRRLSPISDEDLASASGAVWHVLAGRRSRGKGL